MFGEKLFVTKTDGLKNGLVFVGLGIVIVLGANVIYAKVFGLLVGAVFIVAGLFFLLQRNDKITFYEKAVVLALKEERIIDRAAIAEVQYRRLKGQKSLLSAYYPVLLLQDGSEVLLNVAFNQYLNRDFQRFIKSYLAATA